MTGVNCLHILLRH